MSNLSQASWCSLEIAPVLGMKVIEDSVSAGGEAAEAGSVRLGPFLMDSEGRLRPCPGEPPSFMVRWQGRSVRARLLPSGTMSLLAILACVPSSADGSEGPALRNDVFACVRDLPSVLPPTWQMSLLPDHHVGVTADLPLGPAFFAQDLLTELTVFLLQLDPYLALLEANGTARPVAEPLLPN